MTPATDTKSCLSEEFKHDHPEVGFPEDAIAHLYISLDRINRQIHQLQDAGITEGCLAPYQKKGRTCYNHVRPGKGGKTQRSYVRQSEVARRREEIARGREVQELKEIAETLREAIARLDRVQGLNASEPLKLERSSGRVEEEAIAL